MFLNLKGKLLSLETPIVMGIANFTEDSFFDGGRYFSKKTLLKRVDTILKEGAEIVDIGAASTRPGALDLDAKTERERIVYAVKQVVQHFPDALLSIDTWRAEVAKAAIEEGAAMINDISGGNFDEKMLPLIGKLKVPYCLMHTTAKPDSMQHKTNYQSLIDDIFRFLASKIKQLKDFGANDIIIDPGFGFGKTLEQNYLLMQNLQAFSIFKLPLLVGISRKSMICELLTTCPQNALNGSTVLNAIALQKGANILRVHDVKEAVETVKIVSKCLN
jgi:dihydropteroate synthase